MGGDKTLKQVLKEIFPKISVKKILDYYDVSYSPHGDELVTNCIFHESYRGKIDKNPSLSVNVSKKLYNCFSCPASGNIYQLVMQLEISHGAKSCSFSDAVKKICEINNIEFEGIFKVSKDAFNEDMSLDDVFNEENNKIVEVFNDSVLRKYYLKHHNYFLDRGFEQKTLNYFEMGFSPSGKDKDRCIFPVRNAYGGLVGWTGRTIRDNVKPKWLHRPKDRFFTSLNLFNIDKALPHILKTGCVYVVESVGNCMKMYEAGFLNCVAILGNQMSSYQSEMLMEYANHIFLLYDNDDGGYDGTDIAVDLFYDKDVRVSIGQYDFGVNSKGYAYDIADVSVDVILNKIVYIDINEYIDKKGGVMTMLDNIDIKEPITISTDDGSFVVLTDKIDEKCKYPQLCLDDILYIKRLNNLFGVTGLEATPAKPFY